MDVYLLSGNSLKLKIKKTNIIVNPQSEISKTEADVILGFGDKMDTDRVKEFRLIIAAPGEYEVGGLKISTENLNNGFVFSFSSEAGKIALLRASTISNVESDKIKNYQIAIIEADEKINQSVITAMEPRIIIVYGSFAKEAAKELGNVINSANKLSINEEKLPEETEVYLLS